MSLDLNAFTPVTAALGGALIGLAAASMWLGLGRIAGISGITGGLLRATRGDRAWRIAFVAGLVAAPHAYALLASMPPAHVSAGTGLLVTAGTLRSGRQHRQQEWALLRALGASRRQVSAIATGEYLLLGSLGALAGILLAMLASWSLTRWVFKTGWSLDLPFLVAAWTITTALVAAMGWLTARRSGRVAPLELLREER